MRTDTNQPTDVNALGDRDLQELKCGIWRLGEDLVKCGRECGGITNCPTERIIPRGLILEYENRAAEGGVIVVGINPKNAPCEAKEYKSKVISYDVCVKFWNKYRIADPYHKPIREIVDSLGLRGPILWTELVKCENEKGKKGLQINTIQTCADLFLRKEVDLAERWPIVTIGKYPYCYCISEFQDRTIIGLYHPEYPLGTKIVGEFRKLNDRCKALVESRKRKMEGKSFRISPREMFNAAVGKQKLRWTDDEAWCE